MHVRSLTIAMHPEYSGRAAPKTHPEYLIARRPGRLVLNLVDAPSPDYIPYEIMDAAVQAIHENIGTQKVLVHCTQGASRSPTIALLYLAKFTPEFEDMTYEQAAQTFQKMYPEFFPAAGVSRGMPGKTGKIIQIEFNKPLSEFI